MNKSETIELLAQALLKAQTEFMTASKDAKNPFFKSKYATLNSVWEAVATALHNNGLVCIQPIVNNMVATTIIHTSGQFITSECPIVCAKQNDPQALGSAITYSRRYALASMLGVMTDDDDDAESAMVRKQPQSAPKPAAKPAEKTEPAPVQIPAGNLSNKCAMDIMAARSTKELISIYNAYATTEPITDLQAACAAMRKQLESGNSAE